ncbi:hypothetical protein pdam_00004258 [Pocillopora damicornis]|uniref:Ubiquitin-like domain-containing protein n=1 Tax=Pocillopora damicornis TaxID=46731 RepID=A0A3M6UGF6_POCDA|nr:hypothetical protein pdam_00004258 [Pocillopora damicornis]
MEFYVEYYSPEGNWENGKTKLSVPALNTTTIEDVKYMLQVRIQVPVCDQRLFYQGRALTDDRMTLSRLYFREGDTLHLQFTAVADIQGMIELLDVLKKCAREIEEKPGNKLPDLNEDSPDVWQFYDRLLYTVEELGSFFFPWKCPRTVAQRHFFVQERGFDAFLEVFKFSRQLFLTEQQERDLILLVECDSNIQEKVSNMPAVVNKLLFMIDRYQSEPAGYSLFSSQVASNALFYCTFNVKSAQSLVNCGAVEKLLHITKAFLNDKDGNTPLRYYCCLSLARMCSAPLVKLDIDTCKAIHELIDLFLDSHVPNEISEWEEKSSYVWMTMVPLVHLAFAGRIENNRQRSSSTQKLGIFSLVHMLSIEENQQLALSENLFPYLVCLSWHLPCDGKEKLRTVLANNVFTPPSLKVAAKSVLALTRGLDMVFNL